MNWIMLFLSHLFHIYFTSVLTRFQDLIEEFLANLFLYMYLFTVFDLKITDV